MSSPVWSRWITTATVLLLAAIAAVVSYAHMFELALRHGEPAWRAGLFPLSVDGMIIAASMSLLSDARQGRRGGVLPWTLLIAGSVASLAANVAVADSSTWSRVIHAWPSFALMGAYELLMRQFRAGVQGVRNAGAGCTQIGGEQAAGAERDETPSASKSDGAVQSRGRRYPHAVPARVSAAESVIANQVDDEGPAPRVQVDAWRWALENRRADGLLPTGKEVAERFGRKARWGRLVKQRGEQGLLDVAA